MGSSRSAIPWAWRSWSSGGLEHIAREGSPAKSEDGAISALFGVPLHTREDLQKTTEDYRIDPMRTTRRGSVHAHVVETLGEFCQTTKCCSFDAGKRSHPVDGSWPRPTLPKPPEIDNPRPNLAPGEQFDLRARIAGPSTCSPTI